MNGAARDIEEPLAVTGEQCDQQGGSARDFEQALDAITAELLAGPAIDYQHRREALATWPLEP